MRFEIELNALQIVNVMHSKRNGIIFVKRRDGDYENVVVKPILSGSCDAHNRREVLQEIWRPYSEIHEYYTVNSQNEIDWSVSNGCNVGLVCAPNYELAKEIVSIREGRWLPKKDDHHCWIWKKDLDRSSGEFLREYEFDPRTYDVIDDYAFFPSIKQRTAFIEKNKPKERPCDSGTLVSGREEKKLELDKIYTINGDLFILDANDRLQKVYLAGDFKNKNL